MKQYKYILDKGSKKFICPRCNKRTFVKYIETETDNYLSDEFGRCDREQSCNYHNTPKGELSNSYEVKYIAPPNPSYHSLELLDETFCTMHKNNFSSFLETIFTKDEVFQAEQKYFITGHNYFKGCSTVFWQIDNLERVRGGKILQYDKLTGKRKKTAEGKSLINWMHSIMKIKDFNLKQCLFGLHLINETKQRTIAIIEGEKSAIIMSIFKPQYTWLATGSQSGFKFELLEPIKDFNIVAFPDKGEYNAWLTRANELNKIGFKIIVNNYLENTNYKEGSDIADIFINETKKALDS